MSDPADLPRELLAQVLDHLYPPPSPECVCIQDHDDAVCRVFNNCILVNKRWYEISIPRLYHRWTWSSQRHNFNHLWRFLRTIIRHTRLAGLVHALDIREWHWGHVKLSVNADDPQNEVQERDKYYHFRQAMRAIPWQEFKEVQQAIEATDLSFASARLVPLEELDVLILFILTCLPNLSSLTAVSTSATNTFSMLVHDSGAILLNSSVPTQRRAFQNLREANFFGPGRYPAKQIRLDGPQFLALFHLPNLQKLAISHTDLIYLGYVGPTRASNITHLTIFESTSSKISSSSLSDLLSLPKRLVRLSLLNTGDFQAPGTTELQTHLGSRSSTFSNDVLTKGLLEHKDSLEYFDFYRGHFPKDFHPWTDHLPLDSLRELSHLKDLRIQSMVFLGRFSRSRNATTRQMIDQLPSSLESLTLYGKDGNNENCHLMDQITAVIAQKTTAFPCLGSINLQIIDEEAQGPRPFSNTVKDQIALLSEASQAKGLQISVSRHERRPGDRLRFSRVPEVGRNRFDIKRHSRMRKWWGEEDPNWDPENGYREEDPREPPEWDPTA